MNNFDEVYHQFSPMITAVLKKARVYKNHQYYRHIATIALWEAYKKFNPSKGDFAPFAYRYMLTSIYSEMNFENKYESRMICYEKEKLDVINQYMNKNLNFTNDYEILDDVLNMLNTEEIELLSALYIEGYSYGDLHKKTGVSVDALKKRRNRLMKKIRESLTKKV